MVIGKRCFPAAWTRDLFLGGGGAHEYLAHTYGVPQTPWTKGRLPVPNSAAANASHADRIRQGLGKSSDFWKIHFLKSCYNMLLVGRGRKVSLQA